MGPFDEDAGPVRLEKGNTSQKSSLNSLSSSPSNQEKEKFARRPRPRISRYQGQNGWRRGTELLQGGATAAKGVPTPFFRWLQRLPLRLRPSFQIRIQFFTTESKQVCMPLDSPIFLFQIFQIFTLKLIELCFSSSNSSNYHSPHVAAGNSSASSSSRRSGSGRSNSEYYNLEKSSPYHHGGGGTTRTPRPQQVHFLLYSFYLGTTLTSRKCNFSRLSITVIESHQKKAKSKLLSKMYRVQNKQKYFLEKRCIFRALFTSKWCQKYDSTAYQSMSQFHLG